MGAETASIAIATGPGGYTAKFLLPRSRLLDPRRILLYVMREQRQPWYSNATERVRQRERKRRRPRCGDPQPADLRDAPGGTKDEKRIQDRRLSGISAYETDRVS